MADSAIQRSWFGAFRVGLEKLGWIEGRNLEIDLRWGKGSDFLTIRAEELATSRPDVILAGTISALTPMKAATSTVPIVFANVADPVINGFVPSLTRPGGNITGFANYENTVCAKWLELLKQIAPSIINAGLIYDPSNLATEGYLRTAEAAASSFGIKVSGAAVRTAEEIERSVGAFAGQPNCGLVILPGPLTVFHRTLIIDLAARHRLPAVYPFTDFVKAGALASYGIDPLDLFERAASYVDRILKGEKPGDLPVQFATKYLLAVNVRTAKTLGLDVPVMLLARTDEVIE